MAARMSCGSCVAASVIRAGIGARGVRAVRRLRPRRRAARRGRGCESERKSSSRACTSSAWAGARARRASACASAKGVRAEHAAHEAERGGRGREGVDAQPDQERRREAGRRQARRRPRRTCRRRWAASHGLRDEAQHGRVERAVEVRDQVVAAVHGERELREVVGADREEVDVGGEAVGEEGHGGHLDHDADRQAARGAGGPPRP